MSCRHHVISTRGIFTTHDLWTDVVVRHDIDDSNTMLTAVLCNHSHHSPYQGMFPPIKVTRDSRVAQRLGGQVIHPRIITDMSARRFLSITNSKPPESLLVVKPPGSNSPPRPLVRPPPLPEVSRSPTGTSPVPSLSERSGNTRFVCHIHLHSTFSNDADCVHCI